MKQVRMCKRMACISERNECEFSHCRPAVAVYSNEWRAMEAIEENLIRVIQWAESCSMRLTGEQRAELNWRDVEAAKQALLKLKKARGKK